MRADSNDGDTQGFGPKRVTDILDVLCPMHLVLNRTGHIVHVGPTLHKLRSETDWVGQRFLEVFALKRPRSVSTAKELHELKNAKLHLQLRAQPMTKLKGVLVPGPEADQLIVNLSFGISVVDAVREFSLSNTDFAATDLTIEMLYLVEAKSAAMEASRKLNQRLQGAMIVAEEQAFTDTLTGLKNRRAFDFIMNRQITAGRSFALMQIDLDFFKAVNDTLGHAAGDHVLQTVSRIMLDETRDSDCVARLGGDEFAILFPDVTDQAILDKIGRRIISQLEVPVHFQDHVCQISASIGTVFRPLNGLCTAKQLIEDADIALYASKRMGRARQTFFTAELKDNAWGDDQRVIQ
jgi:diguanylate cyclase (GGDEF)-like protein